MGSGERLSAKLRTRLVRFRSARGANDTARTNLSRYLASSENPFIFRFFFLPRVVFVAVRLDRYNEK